jgi:hypothetical protein
MKDAKDLIPWQVTDISIRPYDGYWSFNPSIHFDGEQWRCVLRCCDYAMPDGRTIRSKGARTVGQQTKNAMVILDPASWKPTKIYRMHENDGLPRASTPHVGYEDMRLFWTDKGGLQGIAASLHLRRDARPANGSPQSQPPEQVLLSFDGEYNIVAARPVRGDGWSSTAQKNWVPFDHCEEPRFLYSIDKGSLFDEHGRLDGDAAIVRPSSSARSVAGLLPVVPSPIVVVAHEEKQCVDPPQTARLKHSDRRASIRGSNMQVARGRRMMLDAGSARVVSRTSSPRRSSRNDESTRMMGTGRMGLPTYQGLRGGTQLVRVADDAWLGIGHEMKYVNGKKFYFHTWYVVDSLGKLTATSEPIKLAPEGIEFAAGMAIDGDRVVVSFGVDDMNCRLGETALSAVMERLRPVERR